jgi:hypothetical protein
MKTKQENYLKLIDIVSRYPQLYDKAHPEYRNQLKKTVIWEKIATEAGFQGFNNNKTLQLYMSFL